MSTIYVIVGIALLLILAINRKVNANNAHIRKTIQIMLDEKGRSLGSRIADVSNDTRRDLRLLAEHLDVSFRDVSLNTRVLIPTKLPSKSRKLNVKSAR